MYGILKECLKRLGQSLYPAKLIDKLRKTLRSVTAPWRPNLSQLPRQFSNITKCIENTKGEALEITPASKNEFKMLPVSVEIYLGNE